MTRYLNWPDPTIIEYSFARASIRDQSIATPLANRKLRCGRVRTLLGQCLLPMLSGEAEEN
jgi:hypothetical protein